MNPSRDRPRSFFNQRRRPARCPVQIEVLEARQLLTTYLVNALGDSGAGTLRQAILDSNAHPGFNIIDFQTSGTIQPGSPLPTITSPVEIDGDTAPDSSGNPTDKTEIDVASLTLQIDGSSAGAGAIGLDIQSPNCTIDGLAITGFSGAGISISGAGSQGNWLWGNFLGTLSNTTPDRTYPTGMGNGDGLVITASNNRVGGSNPGLRNVIADNTVGVSIAGAQGTGNLIENNFILDNAQQGVLVASSNNTIGEALQGGGNVISGNGAQGIEITGGPGVQGNLIVGDEIGTDIGFGDGTGARPRGVDPRPNGDVGVLIENSPNNTIGGLSTGARNVIAGNISDGVLIDGAASVGNVLQNNYIGFNINNGLESRFIPNLDGVRITSANNTIGGTTVAAQNTIDNNHDNGIELDGAGASGNVISGNIIGLNPDGGTNFGNALDGIHIDNAPNNVIGGTTAGQRNTISGNNNGIVLLNSGATGNILEGNFIGTATDGVTELSNAVNGVTVSGAPRNTIGGSVSGAGNVIAGNNNGVWLTGAGTMGNLVQGNFIGTDLTAQVPIGSKVDGVIIDQNASQNTIGGLAPGAGNTIAFNVGIGVEIDSGTANPVLSNSIFSNTKFGIDLSGDGVTPNHPGGSISGPNNLENYPVLTAVTPAGSSTNVQGTFNSTPDQTFTLQFFASAAKDPSGFGQGQTFLGTETVTTDDSGNATFQFNLPVAVPSGQFVTATATDANNDTSEFSNSLPSVPVQLQFSNATYSVTEGGGAATITISRTGGTGGQVIVTFVTGGGTAVAGTDYTPVNTPVIFDAGETTKTVTIPILNDPLLLTSATVGLTLSDPTNGATLGSPTTATLTIAGSIVTNPLVSAPSLSAATSFAGNTQIQGQLNGATTGDTYTVTFFTAASGLTPQSIGTLQVTATGATTAFLANLPATVPVGQTITATTTDASSNVSPLSTGITVTSAFLVINTNDSGIGSLRQAILNANANPGLDIIRFAIAASGLHTIQPLTPLPTITDLVQIDGYSEPGSAANDPAHTDFDSAGVMVQIDGGLAGPGATGLNIQAPNCTIDGLAITGFSGAGIAISGANSQGNWLFGNFLGTLSDPTTGHNFPTGLGNTQAGLLIASSNNRIGGNNPGLRNVIVGNGVGVSIPGLMGTGNLLQNNFILDNLQQGILVDSSNNTIGEALQGGGNVISGNGAQGVEITGGPNVQGNLIVGNEIGTDIGFVGEPETIRGTSPLPNHDVGVLIEDSPNNTIGGLTAAARNIIAGNTSDGVLIDGANATGNLLQDNYIGFNIVNGLEALDIPNIDGIRITSARNTIGGTTVAAQNTIDLNHANGITLFGPGATGNVIEGNIIGLNPDGGSDFGNTLDGILIDGASNNTIGGTTAGARNTISGNNDGVVLNGAGATGNLVAGNFIGTATDGVTDLGNAVDGVILSGAPRNTIGGTVSGAANVIAGNNNGVRLTGAGTMGNLVQGNFIGTDLTAQVPIGNEVDGVLVDSQGGASQNTIGGLAPGAGNTIAFNVGIGVEIDSGTANPVLSNSIFSNTKLGIDLSGDGVTPNHPGGSTSGPNHLENYPVLTAVAPAGGSTNVQGTFNSTPGQTFTLQFFASAAKDPSGFGQGQTFLGTETVTTDSSGNAAININLPMAVPSGQFVTATATDANNDTSEFSNSLPSVPVQLQLSAASYSVNENGGAATITVTRTGGTGGQVIVTLATGGGTAVAGTDYTPVSTPVIFNPGETTKTVTIPILNPSKVATSGTVGLSLSNPLNGATLGSPASATLTILDNEPASLQFSTTALSTTEAAGTVTVTVTRNTGNGTATVAFSTGGGSAVPALDYSPISGTLTFTPGETTQTFRVPILDNHLVEGSSTIGLTLSNPNGAILGASNTATITIAAHEQTGVLQFSAPSYSTTEGTGSISVAVTRAQGAEGQVTVTYASGGGDAQPGTDYTPVAGTLTFNPGETIKTIVIPIAANRAGADASFNLVLSQPTGGATLGNPASATIIVPGAEMGPNPFVPSGPGPVVEDLSPLVGPQGIVALVLQFNEALDPTRAQTVANYGYFIFSAGRDAIFGTGDDSYVSIAAAAYDPTSDRVIVTPAAPLPLNLVYQIGLNQQANPTLGTGITDVSGNLLDGAANGGAGTPYVARFTVGTNLRYTDGTGNLVSLQLAKGGLLDLVLGADGSARRLRLESTRPGKSALTGSVKRFLPGSNGHTVLPVITGTAGVKIKLKASQFTIGALSAAAVDAVLGSKSLVPKRRPTGHR